MPTLDALLAQPARAPSVSWTCTGCGLSMTGPAAMVGAVRATHLPVCGHTLPEPIATGGPR